MKFAATTILIGGLIANSFAMAVVHPAEPPAGHASVFEDQAADDESATPTESVAEIASRMVRDLERAVRRPLTKQERHRITTLVSAMESSRFAMSGGDMSGVDLKRKVVDLDDEGEVTVLGCVGGKGAAGLKAGGSVCVGTDRRAHTLRAGGIGFAAGLAITADVLVHIGGKGTLEGVYYGITAGASAGSLNLVAKGILRLLGGEFSYFKNQNNGSKLIVGGLAVGRMVDFSGMALRLK